MKKYLILLAVVLSPSTLAVDLFCQEKSYTSTNDNDHHLLRLEMDELTRMASGTHYWLREDTNNLLIEVKEYDVSGSQIEDIQVWVKSGYFGRGAYLNRQTLHWNGALGLHCKIVRNFDQRLASYRAQAEANTPELAF